MNKLLRWLRWLPWCAHLGETREERVMRTSGCVCYCPGCSDILQDQADAHTTAEGWVAYVCSKCGWQSEWDFSTPAPLLIRPGGESG